MRSWLPSVRRCTRAKRSPRPCARKASRAVYSVPGSHIHPIYDGLSPREVRSASSPARQEPNVSLMADAYGRLTGKPGVCLVTAGPGGLNSMAGVAQAYGAASPMVHIGGAVPLKADTRGLSRRRRSRVRARDVQEDHQVERARRAHRGHSRSHGEGLPHRAQRAARARCTSSCRACRTTASTSSRRPAPFCRPTGRRPPSCRSPTRRTSSATRSG